MKQMKRIYMILCLLAACMLNAQAQLVINELMQSNVDCIMDDLNDFPDSWVELYNTGSTAVNLNQYRLGKTEDAATAWKLPNKTVAPKQYVLIYCDKAATGLHTDFRLESGKGAEVWLFQNSTIADKVTGLKKQPAPNIAYGRQTNGASTWGYQATPTPNAANCGQLCNDILGEPLFSEEGRVFTGSKTISLVLSLPADAPAGTVIRYTINGDEPTVSSTRYTNPITIGSNRIVRAKLFCDGWLSPRSTTHSYLFFPRQLTLPVVSLVTSNKYLTDSKIGIYVEGSYQSGKNNYDFNWRRPVNIEYFEDGNTTSALNQLGETRIQGGASRGSMLKSMVVYANKRFGTKRLEYEFFPDQRPGVTDYKSIVLRNAGNDFDYLYMRDAIIQRTMAQHADLDWQAWQPAIVYINGTYKGILNIRERSNEDNIYTNYAGLEDIDMFENWSELKEGDWDNYNRFKDFYAEHGHTLAEYEQWIDWKEFINLMAMNLYYNNQDFPGNNIVMWRPRTADGRWRFVAKDTDFGLGLYGSSATYKSIEWLYNPNYDYNRNWANQYEHTRLFRRMMDDADFKREFIDRTAVYMGDFMNEKGTRAIWDDMYEQIKYEYPYHRQLINQWWPNYSDELNSARNWLSARTASFYQQLADYYKLGTPTKLTVNKNLTETELAAVNISFNGVQLTQGVFDGKFFANRNITLSGTPANGKEVTGWSIRQVSSGGSVIDKEVSGAQYSFTMPVCNTLVINAILGNSDGIDQPLQRSWTWTVSGNRLLLHGVTPGTPVSLYDARGMQLYQGASQTEEMPLPLSGKGIYILKVGSESVKIY